jgi:hypothetical protein
MQEIPETSGSVLFLRSTSVQSLTVARKPALNLQTGVSGVDTIFCALLCIDHCQFSGSYDHGSAKDIDIISKFICDTLVNSCGADQTARTTCASALTAADQKAPKTGAQADAFNAEFGIFTNFSATPTLDDQGRPVIGSEPGSSSPDSGASDPPDFGKCSKPEILFASNLDGRKETAFAPVDQGSA